MISYFLKRNKRKSNVRKQPEKYFNGLYSKRRFTHKDLYNLTGLIFFFLFLIIALKIGGAAFFTLYNLSGFNALENSRAINLPVSEYSENLSISSRHLIPISIHNDGHVRIDQGKMIVKKDYVNYFKLLPYNDPQCVAFLIVDKSCKMKYVKDVIYALKKAGIQKIRFFTAKTDNVYL